MVRDYVLAGYVKIHLDASMPCAGDSTGVLDSAVAAQRAAELCRAAEDAWTNLPAGSPQPVYVIGTEVPVPGGEQLESGAPAVTKPEAARQTLEEHRATFAKLGLEDAFSRVIGLVVQPGVEFGSDNVFGYDRRLALHLSGQLPKYPELVYEAHSTDYQSGVALRQMVEDHFAILKVGPWLTFAMREAIFALCSVEEEWLGWRSGVTISRVRQAIEQAMLENGGYWKDYYTGTEGEVRLARAYSFSDRIRYYWPDQKVQAEIEILIRNLADNPPPLTLLSQFLPAQYDAVRNGKIRPDPVSLIRHRIGQVLDLYSKASTVTT